MTMKRLVQKMMKELVMRNLIDLECILLTSYFIITP